MIDANWQPYSLNPCLLVIYGQEVRYAARGQDARSRPAQAGIQWCIQDIPASAGMPVFEALMNPEGIYSELPSTSAQKQNQQGR